MKILPLIILLFLTVIVSSQNIRINEFMAKNSTILADNDGDYSDWIEIYNPTAETVNLNGYSLTDNKANPEKWKFPNISLEPNGYLIVFASGKDYAISGQELHTNFSLSKDGEFLGLYKNAQQAISIFDPNYPEQTADISFAYKADGNFYFATPTPGADNLFDNNDFLNAPTFSIKHGFYKHPFKIALNIPEPASIFYTTDGSTPSEKNGIQYIDSILIDRTTILRAIAISSASVKSQVSSQSYFFIDNIKNQAKLPTGYPEFWGPYTAISGNALGDYEMDPEIINDARYSNDMESSLLSIPTMSITTDIENLFSASQNPDSGGIYYYTGPPENNDVPGLGDGWERPASVEYFNNDGTIDFTGNCGLRLHGGHSRRAEKTPKHSFRLAFRSIYGINNLNYPIFGNDNGVTSSFNTLILRAGYGNSWLHMYESEQMRSALIRDLWAKDLQLELGHVAGHGNYVHLYLNGLYWGIYNPTERIDKDFAKTYLDGKADDFDIIKDYGEVVDGDNRAWLEMFKLARKGLADNENYQLIQGKNPDGTINQDLKAYVDVENFIDYMILNFYGSNWDWDHHNWVAVRNRENPGKGFIFLSWDGEHIIESVEANNLNIRNSNCPSDLFQLFKKNTDFRKLFAERVDYLCFNSGALTPEKCQQRWMNRANQIDMAIISESARWGDYRRDVHNLSNTTTLYTKEHWLEHQSFIINDYFTNRTDAFIEQLAEVKLYPFDSTSVSSIPMAQNLTSLSQNYPNPFREYTNISYTLTSAENVKLLIYDVYGNVVEQLVSQYQQNESYVIRYNGATLPEGIYFYKLIINNKPVETKKMIHLR